MNFTRFRPATLALLAGVATLAGVMIVRAEQGRTASNPGEASTTAIDEPRDLTQLRTAGASCFDANDYACAIDAYQKAVAIAPDDASLWSALGEARATASQHDPMPAAALDAFRRAVALAPKDPRARYFLAVNKDLSGDHKGALDDWLTLLAETPPGAPWEKDLRRTIEQVGKLNAIAVTERLAAVRQPPPQPGTTVPGPGPDDLAAATSIPPSQQRAMAEAMVDKLEARLAADPHSADGWIMLIRSRINLDQRDRAVAALQRALQTDPGDAARIRAGADQMGLH
jgi:cytochrome c-type biogenesis protein CcmH